MKKRIISIVLAIVMVLGIIPWTAIPVAASSTLTLAELRAKYPHGYYWNHANNPGASNSVNNPGGVTSTPCSKHGVVGTSQQTCNGFTAGGSMQLSWQCMGYAEQLGYLATGYNPRNNANGWQTYTSTSALDNLKAGDIVRYKSDGHSIYVTGVNGDTVTYTDCNSDGHCIIRWDQTITKSTLRATFTYVRSAPSSPLPETDDCEHWYTTWEVVEEVSATCTEEGYWIEVEYCDDCGEEISRETYYEDPWGHSYDYEIIEEVPATCTEAGYWVEREYCWECGEEFGYETYYEDPLGHDIWTETVEEVYATCTEAGYWIEREYCWECGEEFGYETYYEDPLGHEYEVVAEDWDGTLYRCVYCGDEYHEYNERVYAWFEDYFYFDYALGEYATIPEEIPYAFGQNFGGWYNEEQDAVYYPGDGFYIYANTAFSAIWYEADALGSYTGTVSCPINFDDAGYFVTINPAITGSYVIEGMDAWDTVVYLYDSRGTLLASDDDSGEDYQFRVVQQLTAGETYYIYVRFFNSDDTGWLDWSIAMNAENAVVIYEYANGEFATYTYAIGEYATVPSDIPYVFGCNFTGWYDSYWNAVHMPGDTFQVAGDMTLYAQFDMVDLTGAEAVYSSSAIDYPDTGYFAVYTPSQTGFYVIEGMDDRDTVVYLYDNNGNLIDSDDDSGGNLQFRLEVELIAGETYVIYVYFYDSSYTDSLEWFLGLSEEHVHEYVVDYTIEPDCYNEGYTVYTCFGCGSSYADDFVEPQHDYYEVEIEPTCEEWGVWYIVCSICGDRPPVTDGGWGEPLGHDYVETVVAPTYESEGYTLHECQRCGDSYMDNFVDPLEPETDMLLQIGDVTARAGETIEVPIYLSDNAGFSYLRLALEYDSDIFEFVSATNGTVAVEDFTAGKNLLWVEAMDTMENGLLVTLTFLVKEDVTEGDYTIGATVKECYNEAYKDVSMLVASGTVTIVNIMYGDVNGDGKVDGRDLLKLKRYLANFDDETETSTEEISAGADVNGDGKVDGRDLLKLKRYLANYDDETGTSTEPLGPTAKP